MPKQTVTLSDFSGGVYEKGDSSDLDQSKFVVAAQNVDFGARGYIYTYPTDRSFANEVGNNTGLTIADLDIGLGHATSTNSAALKLVVGTVDSPDADLSWEDGIYNFKYTVCKDLGNGIIEEGPLQLFYEASGGENMAVDMTADDMGGFTFTHSGTAHPDWMDTDDTYEGKIAARVYYSRVSGQGSITQPGYIHLCDLILVTYDTASRILPRAIGTTGTPGTTATKINIEEPPASASFEMNAGYPSDVGIASASTDFGTKTGIADIGLVKYVAYTSGSKYYIYRNVPGHPDIWPKDNWIDMTAYGACLTLLDSGNFLLYFTATNVIIFDVIKDTVVKTLHGIGVVNANIAHKCGESIVWATGFPESDLSNYADHLTYQAVVYSFDGSNIKELTKQRIIGVNSTGAVAYNKSANHLRFTPGYGATGSPDYYIYSLSGDYWTAIKSGGVLAVTLQTVTMGDPSRLKKIYKIIIMSQNFHGASGNGTTSEIASILTGNAFVKNEDGTDLKSSFTQGSGGNIGVFSASSVKARTLSIGLELQRGNPVSSVSVVYRNLNKWSD